MTAKVVKATSKGQITLPVKWREQFKTDHYILEMREKRLVLKPMYLEEIDDEDDDGQYVSIWNSKRDNKGKGIPIDEVIRILEEIDDEQD